MTPAGPRRDAALWNAKLNPGDILICVWLMSVFDLRILRGEREFSILH